MAGGPDNPTGGGFSLGHFIGKLTGGGGQGGGSNFQPGLDYMGDFDPISFVNSNLTASEHSKGGLGLKDITQGVAGLLGIGKHDVPGSILPSKPPKGVGDQTVPSEEGAPLNPNVGKIHPVHATHALDFLDSVLKTLSADPNTGAQ